MKRNAGAIWAKLLEANLHQVRMMKTSKKSTEALWPREMPRRRGSSVAGAVRVDQCFVSFLRSSVDCPRHALGQCHRNLIEIGGGLRMSEVTAELPALNTFNRADKHAVPWR